MHSAPMCGSSMHVAFWLCGISLASLAPSQQQYALTHSHMIRNALDLEYIAQRDLPMFLLVIRTHGRTDDVLKNLEAGAQELRGEMVMGVIDHKVTPDLAARFGGPTAISAAVLAHGQDMPRPYRSEFDQQSMLSFMNGFVADQHLRARNLQKAEHRLRRVLVWDPTVGYAWEQLGLMHHQQGDLVQACHPRLKTIIAERVVLQTGCFQAARHYDEAINRRATLAPESGLHYYAGNAKLGLADWDGARRAFEEAIRRRPNDSHAHRELGLVFKLLGIAVRLSAHHRTIPCCLSRRMMASVQDSRSEPSSSSPVRSMPILITLRHASTSPPSR